jgi:hypothetical protein
VGAVEDKEPADHPIAEATFKQWAEVRAGLEPGELVAVGDLQKLVEGGRVQLLNQSKAIDAVVEANFNGGDSVRWQPTHSRDRGQQTPYDAVETILWALSSTNYSRMREVCYWPGEFRQLVSQGNDRDQFRRLTAKLQQVQSVRFKSHRVVAPNEATILLEGKASDELPVCLYFSLVLDGNRWKVVFPSGAEILIGTSARERLNALDPSSRFE